MKVILGYANVFAREMMTEQARQTNRDLEITTVGKVIEIIDTIHRGEKPDLIILDTGLADMKGLAGLTRVLDVVQRKIPVAMMGAPTSQSEMRLVLEAGAAGYIPKNIGMKAYFSAMTLMAEGEIFLPADSGNQNSHNSFVPNNWLTRREKDMLNGLLAGQSNKEIARIHKLSEVTVKHHLKSLRGKLGARNRTHAVCRAIELGIVSDNESVIDIPKPASVTDSDHDHDDE